MQSISPDQVMESLTSTSRFRWSSPDGLEVGIPTDDKTIFVSREKKDQLRERILDSGDDDGLTEDDKPFPWWLAQCIHYGLNFCFTSTDAKSRLGQALLAQKLKRPKFLKKLGKTLKKNYRNQKKQNNQKKTKAHKQNASSRSENKNPDAGYHEGPPPSVIDLTGDDSSSQDTDIDGMDTDMDAQSQGSRQSHKLSKERSIQEGLIKAPSIPPHNSKSQKGKQAPMTPLTSPVSNFGHLNEGVEEPDSCSFSFGKPTLKTPSPSVRRQRSWAKSAADDSVWDVPDSSEHSEHSDQDSDTMTFQEYIPGTDLDFLYKDDEYDCFSEYEASVFSPLAIKQHDRLTRSSTQKRKASQPSARDQRSCSPLLFPGSLSDAEKRLAKRIKGDSRQARSFKSSPKAKTRLADGKKENETPVLNVQANQHKTTKTSSKALPVSYDSDSDSDDKPMPSRRTKSLQGKGKHSGGPYGAVVESKMTATTRGPTIVSSSRISAPHILPNPSTPFTFTRNREAGPNVQAPAPEKGSSSRDPSFTAPKTSLKEVSSKSDPKPTARSNSRVPPRSSETYSRSTSQLLTQVINNTGAIGIALMQASQPPNSSGSSQSDRHKQPQTEGTPLISKKGPKGQTQKTGPKTPPKRGHALGSALTSRDQDCGPSKGKTDAAKKQRKNSLQDGCDLQTKKSQSTPLKSSAKVIQGETSATRLPGSQLTLTESAKKYVREVLVPARDAHWRQTQTQLIHEPECTERGGDIRGCADAAKNQCQKSKTQKERSNVTPGSPVRKSKNPDYQTKSNEDSDKAKKSKIRRPDDGRDKASPISWGQSAASASNVPRASACKTAPPNAHRKDTVADIHLASPPSVEQLLMYDSHLQLPRPLPRLGQSAIRLCQEGNRGAKMEDARAHGDDGGGLDVEDFVALPCKDQLANASSWPKRNRGPQDSLMGYVMHSDRKKSEFKSQIRVPVSDLMNQIGLPFGED